jgi:hypothetical protein
MGDWQAHEWEIPIKCVGPDALLPGGINAWYEFWIIEGCHCSGLTEQIFKGGRSKDGAPMPLNFLFDAAGLRIPQLHFGVCK